MSADQIEDEEAAAIETAAAPSANLALTLVVISFCAWTVFQTVQFVVERNHLTQVKTNQEIPFQEATKVRTQIEAITADIVKLASEGNAGAQRVVFELRKRGFKIGVDSKTAKPATK
jgi:hypothetical protein